RVTLPRYQNSSSYVRLSSVMGDPSFVSRVLSDFLSGWHLLRMSLSASRYPPSDHVQGHASPGHALIQRDPSPIFNWFSCRPPVISWAPHPPFRRTKTGQTHVARDSRPPPPRPSADRPRGAPDDPPQRAQRPHLGLRARLRAGQSRDPAERA